MLMPTVIMVAFIATIDSNNERVLGISGERSETSCLTHGASCHVVICVIIKVTV